MNTAHNLPPTSPLKQKAHHYFALEVDNVMYAVPVAEIKYVVEWQEPVPSAFLDQSSSLGFINIRGDSILVTDLRSKLKKPKLVKRESLILVTEIRQSLIGIVVDRVNGIVKIKEGEIEKAYPQEYELHRDVYLGVTRFRDNVLSLISFKLLFEVEISLLRKNMEALK